MNVEKAIQAARAKLDAQRAQLDRTEYLMGATTMNERTQEFRRMLDESLKKRSPDLINKPPHYMHPTLTDLEARFVIENLPYHVGTAAGYLWRCGRKGGVGPIDDLKKARKHISFEQERLQKYALRPIYPFSLPTLHTPGIQRIIEPFAYNIATALRYLLGAQIPWDLPAAVTYITFEIDRLDALRKAKPASKVDLFSMLGT